MSKNNIEKRNVRKLGIIGNAEQPSYYVTLPIDYVRKLGWKQGQKLITRKRGNKLVLETSEDGADQS